MDRYDEIRSRIESAIEKNLEEFCNLSDYIADHPEVSGEEYATSKKTGRNIRGKGI